MQQLLQNVMFITKCIGTLSITKDIALSKYPLYCQKTSSPQTLWQVLLLVYPFHPLHQEIEPSACRSFCHLGWGI